MIEVNSRKLLSETNIGGHDYLRNLVQLPFFLQNSGFRKVKVAQKCSQQRKSFSNTMLERQDDVSITSDWFVTLWIAVEYYSSRLLISFSSVCFLYICQG